MMVSSLGSPALGAVVQPSVHRVLPHLNMVAVEAVARALRETPLMIASIKGVVDPEVPDWHKVVLALMQPGDVGSAEWFETLEVAGRVMEAAAEAFPELSEDIARQVSFEL